MPSPSRTVETGQSRGHWVRVGVLADVSPNPCAVVHVEGRTVALVRDQGRLYAVDNRCPHMGFPLDRGSVCDGILTCHWHHARFDLATGGTFDQWADDVRAYPVEVRDGELWIDFSSQGDPRQHHLERLQVGLERNIPLVIGKAVLPLVAENRLALEPFQIGLEFGTRYRRTGWGQGLTIHTCLRNLLPRLDPDDQPRAVYHGLAAVANDCDGEPPRFPVRPLPEASVSLPTLKRWFRQFIEVRDAEGAERCIASALRAGADSRQMADMLFAAATDHRYIDIGHPLDFTNKALEALDVAGWKFAEERSPRSRRPTLRPSEWKKRTNGGIRSISSRSWKKPSPNFPRRSKRVPRDGQHGTLPTRSSPRSCPTIRGRFWPRCSMRCGRAPRRSSWRDTSLGRPPCGLCSSRRATNSAIGTRPCTPLPSPTRSSKASAARNRPNSCAGIFDAAMSVYLNRFLNVPAVPLPEVEPAQDPAGLLGQLPRSSINGTRSTLPRGTWSDISPAAAIRIG